MKRLQLFELNDQSWYPDRLRDYATDYLETLFTRLGLYETAAPLLARTLERSGTRRIFDLCSGAGGPMLALVGPLRAAVGDDLEIVVSDKYPNKGAFARLAEQSGGSIRPADAPVDVLAVPADTRGMRTLFDALHHFEPVAAKKILEAAARAGAPLAVFDGAHRSLPVVLGSVFIPLLVLLLTPLTRPFRVDRIVFTYLVPILPLLICWDGFVSHLRAHTPDELEAMAREIQSDPELAHYRFEIGELKVGPGKITYLLGVPG
jgi:hypothetical protein